MYDTVPRKNTVQYAVTFVFGNMFYVLFAFAFSSFDVVGFFFVPPAFFYLEGGGLLFLKELMDCRVDIFFLIISRLI